MNYSLLLTLTFYFQEPDDDGWAAIASFLAAYVNSLFIEGMKAITTSFWFLEKIAAGITRFLTEEDMWSLLLDSTLGTLRDTMPDILATLIFSGGGGAGGLIYLALFMAGLLMIIPGVSHLQLVEPTRVISWGVVVSALFLSATPWGYDLIGLVEQMRAGAVQVVIDTVAEEGDLDVLVAQPMMASDADLEIYTFVLPTEFEETYFPQPEDDDYEERTVTFIESPFFTWEMEFEVESESSQEERNEKAETALALSGLTLMPGVVLLMFGIIFATLTASALILIIFFLVSLPLGFFEFGGAILNGIVKQYAYLWAITLLAVILPGILVAAETLAYPSGDAPEPAEMMAFIPVLVVVTIATSYVSAMAASAMTDTFSVISSSISTALAPMNALGSMPQGGMLESALAGGVNVAATAALAAATGGASAALMAGAGSMLNQGSERGGQLAGGVATGLMGADRASVFATAARGRGMGAVGQAAGLQRRRTRRQETRAREQAQRSFDSHSRPPADGPAELSEQMGAYTTFNPTLLDRAEQAYQQGQYTTARHHLQQAFGSPQVAQAILSEYEQGQEGMTRVRQMVTTAQQEAKQMASRGMPLFDNQGRIHERVRQRIWNRLSQARAVDRTSQSQAELAARLTGATIRPTTSIWGDPSAAGQLAAHIINRPEEESPLIQDMAAAYALHDMARSRGWSEPQLAALFEATKEAQAASGGEADINHVAAPPSTLATHLSFHGEWANTLPTNRREAARLALLLTGEQEVQAQEPPQVPAPRHLAEQVREAPGHLNDPQAADDLYQLSDQNGWEADDLTTLFEITQQVQSQGPIHRPGGRVRMITERLRDTDSFREAAPEHLERAARNALRLSRPQHEASGQQAGDTINKAVSVPPPPTSSPHSHRNGGSQGTANPRGAPNRSPVTHGAPLVVDGPPPEIPDWFADAPPPDVADAPPDIPDWFADEPPPDVYDGPPLDYLDEPPPEIPNWFADGPPPERLPEIPDWLADGPPPDMADRPPEIPNWLADDPPPDVADRPPEIPDWLADGPPPDVADRPPEIPDWLADGPPPDMANGGSEIPDWLADGPPPDVADGSPPDLADGPPPEIPDWLADGPPPDVANGGSEIPDWLADGPPPDVADGSPPDLADGSPPEIPDWLADEESPEIPDWLADGPPPDVALSPPDIPDWLADEPPPFVTPPTSEE